MKTIFNRTRLFVWGIIVAALISIGGLAASLAFKAQQLAMTNLPEGDVGVAVVFFASHPDDMSLRLDHAIQLYRRGQVARIVIVGGARDWLAQSGAQSARQRVIASGIPEAHVVADAQSFDTRSNIAAIGPLLPPENSGPLLLISDRLHLVRIIRIMGESINERRLLASPHGAPFQMRRLGYEVVAFLIDWLPNGVRVALTRAWRNREK